MKIIDYLPYYLGCDVIIDPGTKKEDRGKLLGGTFVPNSINQIYYDIQTADMRDSEDEDFAMPYNDDADDPARIKPILRRLSDMTEAEIINLLNSMWPPTMEDKPKEEEYCLEVFKGDGGNLVNSDVVVGANYSVRCFEGIISIKDCGTICLYDGAGDEQEGTNIPAAYHYLLRQHFDLFNLIENGIAVDAKTIK
jgi:hypothetical protein